MNYFYLILIKCILLCSSVHQSDAVYSVDTSKFASKNSYASSFSDTERDQAKATLNIINSYCKPLQVSSVLRHGTRNPSKGDINNINSVLSKLKNAGLSTEIWKQLNDSAAKFPISTQGELVQAGVLEHQMIGYRTAETFKDLFTKVGMNELTFSATSKSRTEDSCKGFQTGFFNLHDRPVTAPIVQRDDILRFYDTCDKYTKLEANTSSLLQYDLFQNSTFPQIINNYVNYIGAATASLSNDEMASIYQIGAMEYAGHNTTNWAQYIDLQDMLTLEYSSDLESYYKIGYGYPINYQMSCPLLSTIFRDMDKVFTGQDYQKGQFYFAHAETVAPLFDIMGLYKDPQPLTASNYAQQTNRMFKTGRIIPFATNLAFVQYDCNVEAIRNNISQIPWGTFPDQPQRNMTLMLVKESPTLIPGCSALMCPYSTVRENYKEPIDHCNYDVTCDNAQVSHAVSVRSVTGHFLFVLVAARYLAFKITN